MALAARDGRVRHRIVEGAVSGGPHLDTGAWTRHHLRQTRGKPDVMTNFNETTETAAWPGVRVDQLVMRLRRYNEWRRGAEFEQPCPVQIGADIDAAADMLETMAAAIVETLENNLHLADGDNCTLIDLVRLARGE